MIFRYFYIDLSQIQLQFLSKNDIFTCFYNGNAQKYIEGKYQLNLDFILLWFETKEIIFLFLKMFLLTDRSVLGNIPSNQQIFQNCWIILMWKKLAGALIRPWHFYPVFLSGEGYAQSSSRPNLALEQLTTVIIRSRA